MPRKRQDVTDAELAVLQLLWDREQATARQLTDVLYPGGSFSDYATVKKLLARLEKKGHVSRNARDRAHVFEAKTSRDDLLTQRLGAMADELCSGSRTPLLTSLLKAKPLDEQELQDLHEYLDQLTRSREKQR